jgi:hypothetical protein
MSYPIFPYMNAFRALAAPVLSPTPRVVYEFAYPNVDESSTYVVYSGCNPEYQASKCRVASGETDALLFDPQRNQFVTNLLLQCILPDTGGGSSIAAESQMDLRQLRTRLAGVHAAHALASTRVTAMTESTIGDLVGALSYGNGKDLSDEKRLEVARMLSEPDANTVLAARTIYEAQEKVENFCESDDSWRLSADKFINWLIENHTAVALYNRLMMRHGMYKNEFVNAVLNWSLGRKWSTPGFGTLHDARLQHDPAAKDGQLPEPLL